MRLQILIGYPNKDGSGSPVVILPPSSKPEDIQKQARIFSDAKVLHVFPKGVKFIAFGAFESTELAIFISDDVANEKANAAKAAKKRQDQANALAQARTDFVTTRNAIPKAKGALGLAKSKLPALEKAVKDAKNEKTEAALKAGQEAVTKAEANLKLAEDAHKEIAAKLETLKKQ